MTAKEKARDRHLQKTYGITLDEYIHMLNNQYGTCWICKKPPKEGGRSLHVDHSHEVVSFKIIKYKLGGRWFAKVKELNLCSSALKMKDASAKTKQLLKRASIRALLCWHCNAGLRKWNDDPVRLTNAAEYLKNYQERTFGKKD